MVTPTPAHRQNLKGRKNRLDIKKLALQVYGQECGCCGERRVEFLTFQHSNGDGAAHRKALLGNHRASGSKFLFALYKQGFPPVDGLTVLCFNCHMATDLYGMCPHKKEAIERERRGE